MSRKVAFITLGCSKNEVDTESMTDRLRKAGYEIVDFGSECDVIVVNTCSFIQAAIEESLEVIFDTAQLESVRSKKTKLVVAGCLPSRFGDSLEEDLYEPDLFIPCSKEDDIVVLLDQLFASNESQKPLPLDTETDSVLMYSESFDQPVSRYVKISEGCDKFCSYCTIPFIRGRYHSFSYEEIDQEVCQRVDEGAREIVLIAQDTGLWGSDFTPEESLAHLLDKLASTYPATWFRVMYLQPANLTTELLEVMRSHDNICNYFDIPLQHCNSEILRVMNRKGSREEYEALVRAIRDSFDEVALRTTLIVGFPGETEEMFEELCDFVATAEFDYVGIFPYSPEEGTRAASLPSQIDEDTKLERLQTLRDLADSISSSRISQSIGKTFSVLICGEDEGDLYGRTQYQAPDVDGLTYIDCGAVGDFAAVTIEDSLYYDMEGTVLANMADRKGA